MQNYDTRKDKERRARKLEMDRQYKPEDKSESIDTTVTDQELVGSIYSIKEDFWDFQNSGREGHPGACLNTVEALNAAFLIHGTDANSYTAKRFQANSCVVEPSSKNGLIKATAFILELYTMRLRKLMMYHIDRRIGCLDNEDLEAMRTRIARSHPNPWEDNS